MIYSLRSALESDLESMMRIAHEGLRPHIEPSSGWDENYHREAFKKHFEPTKISIIKFSDLEVGYFKTERIRDYNFLEGIYIGYKYRNMGLGSKVSEPKRVRSWLLTCRRPTIPEAPATIDPVAAVRKQVLAANTKMTEGSDTVEFARAGAAA